MNICKKRAIALVLIASMVTGYGANCSAGFLLALRGFFTKSVSKKTSTSFFKKPKNIAIALGAACVCGFIYMLLRRLNNNDNGFVAFFNREGAIDLDATREAFLAACLNGNLEEAQRIAGEGNPRAFLEKIHAIRFIRENIHMDLEVIQYLDQIYDFNEPLYPGSEGIREFGCDSILQSACIGNYEELIEWLVREKGAALVLDDHVHGDRAFSQRCPVESLRYLDRIDHDFDDIFLEGLLESSCLYGGENALNLLRWVIEEKEVWIDTRLHRLLMSTPLHAASSYGNVEIVRYLLEAGADPRIEDRWVAQGLLKYFASDEDKTDEYGIDEIKEKQENYRQIIVLLEERMAGRA